jgi:hypothetical protein
MSEIDLTRRNVRHHLIRARNERVAAGGPGFAEWPTTLFLNRVTLEELERDGDPEEVDTMDFEGETFMGIPIVQDPRLDNGVFAVTWAKKLPGEEHAPVSMPTA